MIVAHAICLALQMLTDFLEMRAKAVMFGSDNEDDEDALVQEHNSQMNDFEYQKRNMLLFKTLLYFCSICYAEKIIIDHYLYKDTVEKLGKKDEHGRTI